MTRTQPRTDGSLALRLDFGMARPAPVPPSAAALRLAQGPDKYRVLAQRRRRAQIAARRLLQQMEEN
jgi:hypothetical protein